jgi:hypothetical protein
MPPPPTQPPTSTQQATIEKLHCNNVFLNEVLNIACTKYDIAETENACLHKTVEDLEDCISRLKPYQTPCC